MNDLSDYDLDDLEAAIEEHGMTAVGRERWDEVRTDSAELRTLRKGLQDEVERLRAIRSETEWGDDFEAEVGAHADRLAALLDSSGGK